MIDYLPAFKNKLSIRRAATNSHVVSMHEIGAGWKQKFLLTSDRHHDSIKNDRKSEYADLHQALDENAGILDFGDMYDAMQGKGDPRSNLDDLRPEYKTGKYLDTLVDVTAKDYRPFAPNWLLDAYGNHETGVLGKKEVDLTERTVAAMRQDKDCFVEKGGYVGWVVFQFVMRKTVRQSMKLYYSHGSGGSATATFGTGQVRQQASYLSDFDFIVNGHNHNAYYVPLMTLGCSPNGRPYDKVVHSIRTPGYKRGFRKETTGGFETEKGHAPQPVGCAWIEFVYDGTSIQTRITVNAR